MKDSSQLLDLLSAADSSDLEPTKAAAGRVAIYPEVSLSKFLFGILYPCLR